MTGAYRAQEAAVLWSRNSIDDPIFMGVYSDDENLIDDIYQHIEIVLPLQRYMLAPSKDDEDGYEIDD